MSIAESGLCVIERDAHQLWEEPMSNRRSGYDFTFSYEIGVAISSWQSGQGHRTCDRRGTKIRKGYQHGNRVSPKMVFAKLVYGEGRPFDGIPEPHYHIHVFAMNATFDVVEKEWKALEVRNTVGDRTLSLGRSLGHPKKLWYCSGSKAQRQILGFIGDFPGPYSSGKPCMILRNKVSDVLGGWISFIGVNGERKVSSQRYPLTGFKWIRFIYACWKAIIVTMKLLP